MTEAHHPITPPPELVRQWREEWLDNDRGDYSMFLATQGALWGDEQRLEVCCKWVADHISVPEAAELRAAMHPKPPSLAEQAFALLDKAEDPSWDINDFSIVRRALERLQELEKGNE